MSLLLFIFLLSIVFGATIALQAAKVRHIKRKRQEQLRRKMEKLMKKEKAKDLKRQKELAGIEAAQLKVQQTELKEFKKDTGLEVKRIFRM